MQRLFRQLSLPEKVIYVLLVAVFFGSHGLFTYLDHHYATTRPHAPQPELGRIYNLEFYGITAALTAGEQFQLQLLVWIWAGSIFAFIVLVTSQFRSRRRNRPPT